MYTFARFRRWWFAAVATVLIAPVLAGEAMADTTSGEIRNAGGPKAIAGSYIVVLKDAAVARSQVPAKATSLARAYRGTVGYVYAHALRGFSVATSEAQARRLAADPAVAYVEQDGEVNALDTQPNPPSYGLDRIDQRALPLNNSYTFPNTASSVTAYIIDGGMRVTHADFGGRARHGFDFIDNDPVAEDCDGHGTHVAGTVGGGQHGVAKAVKLVALRVLNCAGSGSFAGVAAGVDWVTANAVRPAVANMSLGGIGTSAVLETAVRNSIASGVTYAIAAGNNSIDACGFTPARVAEAITVGATDRNDGRAGFSNFGGCLDVFAPGVNITSTWFRSDTDTNTISGTSMSSPHVAGVAALLLQQNPTATPQAIRNALVAQATSNVVGNPGPGSPNLLLFAGMPTPPQPPAAPVKNLVTNGGFNRGLAPWQLMPGTNAVTYGFGVTGNDPYEGSMFAAMNTNQVGGGIFQDVAATISVGDTFCASARVATQGGAPGAGGSFVLWLLGGGGNENSFRSFANLPGGNGWTAQHTCVTASTAHTAIRVQFYPTVNGPTLVADAVDVHRSLAVNGGFNRGLAPWQLMPGTNAVTYGFGVTGNDPYEGSMFAAMNTNQLGGGIFQDVAATINAGDTFCASAQVATQGGAPGAGGSFVLWLLGGGGNENSAKSVANLPGGNAWTPVSTCVTASTAHTAIRVQFYPNVNGPTLIADAVDIH